MVRVFVIGHRGMLGSVVARHLGSRFDIYTTGARYTGAHDDPLVAAVRAARPHAVVNCAAVLPPADAQMYLVNALLPAHVATAVPGATFVHASTDGVFDGRSVGGYRVTDHPDATDAYGLSKAVGERIGGGAVVLRTSLVGTGRGLLDWLLRSDGPVPGYLDHRWNGITTLAWAKLAERAIAGDLAPGLHHPTTEPVSKYELLRLAAAAFGHPVEVVPDLTGDPVDRTLVPTLAMPPIADQLAELAAW